MPNSIMRAFIAAALCTVTNAETYKVDASGVDKIFWGIGGLSGGGATSRLLVDYQEPQRSQVLDYLFKPNFGANLQILKVEIGGDSLSGDGTEPSHMHSKDDYDVTRGYEWWLMVEAKKRNPSIKLYGLPWAFPGWVGDDPQTGKSSGSPFTYPNQTAGYITKWVKGAKTTYGLDIDYLGIWNERSSSAPYAASLKQTLADEGFSNIKLVARDGGADICTDLKKDPSYNKSIDIIGLHYPSDYANYSECDSLEKPVWASEESSSYDDYNGAACWLRVITSHYVLQSMTSSIMWNLVGSYYHGTNWYASSMMTANQPWSGHIGNLEVAYATAHITQFTKIGWKYLKNGLGSGKLINGGYYTTFVSEDMKDFSIVIVKISHEHAACTRPGLPYEAVENEVANISISENMKAPGEMFVWRSNFEAEKKYVFEKQPNVVISDNMIRDIDISVGDVITISTVSTASKGTYTKQPSQPRFPLPYNDTFNDVKESQEARYCADQIGSFQVTDKVMKQMVPELPIGWADHGSNGPVTLIGMKEWQDIHIQIDVKLPFESASGCVATRSNQMWSNAIAFCVSTEGVWNLTYEGPPQSQVYKSRPISTGNVTKPGIGKWFTLGLMTINNTASIFYNKELIHSNISIRNFDNGFAAFGCGGWYSAEFDNLFIEEAGNNWQPTEPCKQPGIGTRVTTRPCVSNGLTSSDMKFVLSSDYQIIHNDSGLCVTASSAVEGSSLSLQECDFGNPLQAFLQDYTLIRNTVKPITLQNTTLRLVGSPTTVVVSSSTPTKTWGTWSYFPNTLQLRNTFDTSTTLGYPRCLSTCN
eukprot:TRINITY_DN2686_c0_g1_i1.p1 TRINITY_DN2686_c0_g1~~TRINITY_DN2686_c0_g1_i1.p1  ORF type:complete len:815 (+),score=136.15 TRINITY_DN2686_c0_g1_i1:200-2644(+)